MSDDERDRDLSPQWIVSLAAACLLVTGWLAYGFAAGSALSDHALLLTLVAVPFVFVVGFMIAGVAGYMAGLIGASNSPISGIGILGIVACASVVALAVSPTADQPAGAGGVRALRHVHRVCLRDHLE